MEEKRMVIGNSTLVDFPEIDILGVPARVDTGARSSSVWGSATVVGGKLEVVLLGRSHPLYTGKPYVVEDFQEIVISSSMGHLQKRYKVRLLVKLRGKKIRAAFTIADRSQQVYPVLIGRNILRGKFVVDVKKGKSQREKEQERSASLQSKLESL